MRHLKLETAADGFATLLLDNADESMNPSPMHSSPKWSKSPHGSRRTTLSRG